MNKVRPQVKKQVMEAYDTLVGKADQNKVDEILRRIDLSGFDVLVGDESELEEILAAVARDGGAQALTQVGVDDSDVTDQVNVYSQDYARERAAEMVGKKWVDGHLVDNPSAAWSISAGTREALRGDVSRAIDEGMSSAQLGNLIEDNYGFSSARADMIARTEIAFADVAGNMNAYRESGVVEKKQWILGPQACDICVGNADAGEIGVDEDFPSGDDAPPAHPNCECDVIPVVTNEDNDE